MNLSVAMLSVHTCPLAALGGKETGGMNVYVRQTARELGRMGVHVDVFTRSQNPTIPRIVELGPGARVVHLPAGPEAPMRREALHGHLDQFAAGVEAFARDSGMRYDLIHSHYWLSGVAGLRLRERWGTPLVQMFHTLAKLKNAVAHSEAEREPSLREEEESRIVAQADRVVAANVVERAHLVWYYGARAERIAVIPCGVDTDLFQPMDPAKAKDLLELPPDPLLLYVGRLQPIKGLETLLEAMAAVPEPAYLLVVGGDHDEPENGHGAALRQRVTALGLDRRVRFLRAQPQRRLRLFYASADATIIPSYYESFGMVALEAMACGSPVVASRVGGLTTTVQDGVTGRLVPEGDPAALAAAITTLLDRAEGRRLGLQATRWAAEHRWPCVAEAVCRLYSELRPVAEQHLPHARCKG
ncbi:MAG TPA: glycosyltransferase [Candidatus Dormibacteraeota bacterium]|nr:glycosyltransferase [Candidatus Dormibacteraeota bacterium]